MNALGRGDTPLEQPWETALHRVAESGDTESAALLLRLGADPTVRDHRFDATPLDWARHCAQPAVAALLEAAIEDRG